MGHSHKHKSSDPTQLFGVAALAAGIGALAAVLFTKQSGAETREALRAKIQEAKSKPQSMKQDINEAADNAVNAASKLKEQSVDKAKQASDALKDSLDKK